MSDCSRVVYRPAGLGLTNPYCTGDVGGGHSAIPQMPPLSLSPGHRTLSLSARGRHGEMAGADWPAGQAVGWAGGSGGEGPVLDGERHASGCGCGRRGSRSVLKRQGRAIEGDEGCPPTSDAVLYTPPPLAAAVRSSRANTAEPLLPALHQNQNQNPSQSRIKHPRPGASPGCRCHSHVRHAHAHAR
ncbi:hypothetical protein CALCODRAFT_368270 [Calocera cornea HHB12733]|uniref:Uncharacterized protein n=1 Tax=Calocera cornea HHB12733 TaxID=1353952 RepID=A0A165EJH8_9BASI|nr:hypothetical protein CALCODRAFT_368270 [Calocera cornea HHB12733]